MVVFQECLTESVLPMKKAPVQFSYGACGREVKHTSDGWGWHMKSTVVLGTIRDLSSGRNDSVDILGDKI